MSASLTRRPSTWTSRLEPSAPPLLKPRASTSDAGRVRRLVRDEEPRLAAQQLGHRAHAAALDLLAVDHRDVAGDLEDVALGAGGGDGHRAHRWAGGGSSASSGATTAAGGAGSAASSSEPGSSARARGAASSRIRPRSGMRWKVRSAESARRRQCGEHRGTSSGSRGRGRWRISKLWRRSCPRCRRNALSPRRAVRVSASGQVSWLMGLRDAFVANAPAAPSQARRAQWSRADGASQSQWRDHGRFSRPSLYARDGHLDADCRVLDTADGRPGQSPRPRGAAGLDDPALVAAPVAVLEEALEELAGGAAGQLGLEVHRTGALELREPSAGRRRSAPARARGRRRPCRRAGPRPSPPRRTPRWERRRPPRRPASGWVTSTFSASWG